MINKKKVDETKIIIKKPLIYVFGIYCENKKQEHFYLILTLISIIVGAVGLVVLVPLIFYLKFFR